MAIFNTVPPLKAGSGIQFDGEVISTGAAPRNLLDNSDFTNPVNQRGSSSYNQNGYTIDRWAVYNGQLNIGDGYITVKNAYQSLELATNKIYTLAAKTAAGVVCFAAKPDVGGNASLGNLQISMYVKNSLVQILLTNAPENPLGGVYWAALYEGEYTAETLPEYQPKGYGAELAECQRYYLHDVGMRCVGSVLDNAEVVLAIPTPVAFRTAPSVVVKNLDNVICNLGSPQVITLKSVSKVEVRTNCIVVYFKTSLAAGNLQWATVCSYNTSIDLVADL